MKGRTAWVRGWRLALMLGCLACAPAMTVAQTTGAPTTPPSDGHGGPAVDEEDAIVVTGQRERGAVVGDIKPEVQLTPADIRSYGVSSVTELLNELSPETRSGRGRGGETPVVLLNGHRISGFSEIRDLPTEAIERVDILPEEAALKYGYTANQRVVNFVLRRRFNAITGELDGSMPTEGGQFTGEADATLLRIAGDNRLNIALKYQANSALSESERDITARLGGRPYDTVGNITAPPSASSREIDPLLSALAGQIVKVAGVPSGAASGAPSLSDFAATAGIANVNDVARYRTLLPSARTVSGNAVLNRTIFGNVSATANASVSFTDSDSDLGLPKASLLVPAGNPFSPFGKDVQLYRYLGSDPLQRSVKGFTGHLGFSFNGDVKRWHWSLTANYDHSISNTRSDTGFDLAGIQAALSANDPTLNPFGALLSGSPGLSPADRARSRSDTGDIQLVANGPLLDLPAGALSATLKVGDTPSWFSSRSTRSGVTRSADLSRNDFNTQVNVDLPIASRSKDVLAFLGNLSVNGNLAYDMLSDFGTQKTYGYGATWSPVSAISIIASHTHDETAPGVGQLGNPTVLTPGVRVFDFLRGETVEVTRIEGSNPDLVADSRNVFKLGLTVKPELPNNNRLTLTANYVSSRIRNPIAAFPTSTPDLETAFPERFIRDEDGNLLQIDSRPINFAREDRDELRWGINFSKPLKSSQRMMEALRAQRQAREAAQGAVPGGEGAARNRDWRGSGGPGGGGGGGDRGQGGRLQFAAYHTWIFNDEILIREGGPKLDLLNGSAVGATGGQPRHQVEFQTGYSNNGLGARVSGNWQSGTTVDGVAGSATGNLRFSSLTTVNLRLFASPGMQPALIRDHPWLRGSRITFSITNIFNQRIKVRDAAGTIPLSYQPDILDPLGRSFRISFRKLFF